MEKRAEGRLLGIARAVAARGPMEEMSEVRVTEDGGLDRDRRGHVKGAQVTILAKEAWEAACAEVGEDLPWTNRRANLFVEGVTLPREEGARLRIGDVVLEVRSETDPCSVMEKAKTGLRAALEPDWRGGVRCDVVTGGVLVSGTAVESPGSPPGK